MCMCAYRHIFHLTRDRPFVRPPKSRHPVKRLGRRPTKRNATSPTMFFFLCVCVYVFSPSFSRQCVAPCVQRCAHTTAAHSHTQGGRLMAISFRSDRRRKRELARAQRREMRNNKMLTCRAPGGAGRWLVGLPPPHVEIKREYSRTRRARRQRDAMRLATQHRRRQEGAQRKRRVRVKCACSSSQERARASAGMCGSVCMLYSTIHAGRVNNPSRKSARVQIAPAAVRHSNIVCTHVYLYCALIACA